MKSPEEDQQRNEVSPQSFHEDLIFLLAGVAHGGEELPQKARLEDWLSVRYHPDLLAWMKQALVESYNFLVRNLQYLISKGLMEWTPGGVVSIENRLIMAIYQAASTRNIWRLHEVSALDPEVIAALASGWEDS